ncbi:Condensin complex subunit [Phlyctochytrium planicorne]|nr:Condensin complex subunit [Phlyctochytrium planicorne]
MVQFTSIQELATLDSGEAFENEFLVPEYDEDTISQRLDGLAEEVTAATNDLSEGLQETFDEHRMALEFYSFAISQLMEAAESKAKKEKAAAAPVVATTKGKRATTKKAKGAEDLAWPSQRERLLKTLSSMLIMELSRIVIATSERDGIMSMITKAIAFILEDPDAIKISSTRLCIFDIFSICAKKYDSDLTKIIVTRVSQFIQEEHLADSMADLLSYASEKHAFPDLTEKVLRDSKSWEFYDTELKTSKAFSKFITRLSELMPEKVLKGMVFIQSQVDSRSYTVRMAMLDVIGNLIQNYLSTITSETAFSQMLSFFNILQERFRDNKSFVRSKLLQVLLKLTEPKVVGVGNIPVDRWPVITSLAIGRLHDKASTVRKNAVKLLSQMVSSSPFLALPADNRRQSIAYFSRRQKELLETIKQKFPDELKAVMPQEGEDGTVDMQDDEASIAKILSFQPTEDQARELANLRSFLKYYSDGITFFKQLNSASSTLCELLASNVKAEVIEVMRFFVVAYGYGMECSKDGVRKMIHKVWDKDANSSDDEGSIRDTLIQCFKSLYLSPEPEGERDINEVIVNNLINLLQTLNLAELTSLEQLLGIIAEKDMIPAGVIDLLWTVFASKRKETPAHRRRGALAILSMLGRWRKEIIDKNRDVLLRYGLGEFAKALNTIYALAENPDVIAGNVLKRFSARFFQTTPPQDALDEITDAFSVNLDLSDRMETEQAASREGSLSMQEDESSSFDVDPIELGKLFFLVGHVAIKQIAHLEAIEIEWKRRRAKERASKNTTNAASDLEQVVGSAEDEFADMIARIREREILHGPKSLLTLYGPMVVHVCKNNLDFNVLILQVMAVMALCKLMCVSSEFCDENLQLLFTILEKSKDATIRSNTIIGLGDMTVSFNSLIDQNISYLYNRLGDGDQTVKKNALMVLTHLVLNGMVKVKGQISEMAKCIVDEDTRISDLAKLFFSELSTKDNAVYNNLPDIISNLSHKDTGVEEEAFKSIMRYLLEFIKKDRQVENVVDKLCQRFRAAEDPRMWRDIGFCLSLINFSTERPVKKFMEAFPLYQDKLHEPVLFKYCQDIVAKAKKNMKGEMKAPLDEFEKKLNEAQVKCSENADLVQKASDVTKGVAARAKKGGATKGKSASVASAAEPDEAGSPMAEDSDEEEEEEEVPLQRPARNARAPAKGGKVLARDSPVAEDSDEEEEEDDVPLQKSTRNAKALAKGGKAPSRNSPMAQDSEEDPEDSDEKDVEEEEDEAPLRKPAKATRAPPPKAKKSAPTKSRRAVIESDDDSEDVDMDD